ncbi:MAG: Bug family tripartite tricarboxylate transporter substrate binding protein [Lautropia sp.]
MKSKRALPALAAAFAAALVAGAVLPAAAQTYPDKPIRLVVGVGGGGTMDGLARDVAEPLAKRLGQPVVIENRPGAGTNIANELVARAKPDGYTLLFTSNAITVIPSIYSKLNYDPTKDLLPIAAAVTVPNLMTAPVTLPANTVKEFVELARQKPGSIIYASAGNGTVAHLSGALLATLGNVKLEHVPYKGNVEAMTDLINGTVHTNFNQINAMMPMVKSGKLKALAIVDKERSPLMPDVPTMAEQGFPDFDLVPWFGVFGPAGMPQAIVDRIAAEVDAIVKSPEMAQKWGPNGAKGMGGTPAQFAERVRTDTEKMRKLAATAGAKID